MRKTKARRKPKWARQKIRNKKSLPVARQAGGFRAQGGKRGRLFTFAVNADRLSKTPELKMNMRFVQAYGRIRYRMPIKKPAENSAG